MEAQTATLQEDRLVDISERQIGFFGGPGKMLLPSRATVETVVSKIPEGKVLTTDLLRQALTAQFDVQGTCPETTRKALNAIAHDPANTVAYWRVINQSGELIAKFPGGIESHAAHLAQEGITFEQKGKAPKVKHFRENLFHPATTPP